MSKVKLEEKAEATVELHRCREMQCPKRASESPRESAKT